MINNDAFGALRGRRWEGSLPPVSPHIVRRRIWRLLIHRRLPTSLHGLRVHAAAGDPCLACGEGIAIPNLAYAVVNTGGREVPLHDRCFAIWRGLTHPAEPTAD